MKGTAFRVGNVVEWTSQAAGRPTTKRGEIVAIVPAGESCLRHVPKGLRTQRLGGGFPRNHDSYIVNVNGQAYWPRVSHLAFVAVGEKG